MIISRTPLRASLLGGGTDYPEYISRAGWGAVLGTAIDKFVYCSASKFYSGLFDHSIRLSYSRIEKASSLEQVRHAPIRACLESAGVVNDVEVSHSAELPAYSGLGSSSSFVVGLLHALRALRGQRPLPEELASEAVRVERESLGEPAGLQDQTLAAHGGTRLITFRGGRTEARLLELDSARAAALDSRLAMFFTGVQRRAAGVIEKQLARVGDNSASLGRMREMAVRGAHLLESGEGARGLDELGALVGEGWALKRGLDPSVSTPQIDGMYERGVAAGADGGKLLGAGGGGFLLFLVPPSSRASLKKAMEGLVEVPLRAGAPGSSIIEGFAQGPSGT